MTIVPAIDLIDGKCVRLSQGDFNEKTVYSDDPVLVAKRFEEQGYNRLHVVDLDGAKTGSPHHLGVLMEIVNKTSLVVDYSGGLRTKEDVNEAFKAGAAYVVIGSIAVREKQLAKQIITEYKDKIILGADVRDGLIAINGWREQTTISLTHFMSEFISEGLVRVMVTDVNRDGMLGGPNMTLYKEILSEFPKIKLIASGGVSTRKDAEVLTSMGLDEVIVGKALYEGLWQQNG